MTRKKIFIISGIALLLFLGLSTIHEGGSIFQNSPLQKPFKGSEKSIENDFITALPFDLEKIREMSQYRSCAGHDFSGKTVQGTSERLRSMKHYVGVERAYRGTVGEVEIYAPFDGEISDISRESSTGENDVQVWITPNPNSLSQWQFIFFHVGLREGLKEGSKVKSGEVIGSANLARGPGGVTDNFDIGLKYTKALRKPILGSPFNHLSSKVEAEFAEHGITPENMILSKEYRDNNPCPVEEYDDGPDSIFPQGAAEGEWIQLK